MFVYFEISFVLLLWVLFLFGWLGFFLFACLFTLESDNVAIFCHGMLFQNRTMHFNILRQNMWIDVVQGNSSVSSRRA